MGKQYGCITDVPGILVGHSTHEAARTGCTAILIEGGGTVGVDIGGSAPGTRETELLDPTNMICKVHALCFAGGSTFGLRAASGVQEYLRAQGMGYHSSPGVIVPIVPSAVIFDLEVGDPSITPGRNMGREACEKASSEISPEGLVGAGTGATCGRMHGIKQAMKGGVGSASLSLNNGVVVGALAVCNAWGDVLDPDSGKLVAGLKDPETGELLDTEAEIFSGLEIKTPFFGSSTTLCAVATNAAFSREQITKVAKMAQDGIARAVRPSHTLFDGDIVFSIATGTHDVEVDLNIVGTLAARLVARAIVHGVSVANGGIVTPVKDFGL